MTASSKTARLLAACVLAVVLAGCENLKSELGLGKQSPDEFRVVSRAPLAIPPEFSLRPPKPGAPRPQTGTPTDQARNALFGAPDSSSGSQFAFDNIGAGTGTGDTLAAGNPTATAPVEEEKITAGEKLLLNRAGAQNADPNIRTLVNRETDQIIEDDKNLVDLLVFWRSNQPTGDIVDPQKEADRLRENAALGKPVTAGETPTIKRRKKALLEGIF
jgi:hypothetical protein